jgi:transcriptional regulator with XRE-family HTH domain
VAWDRMLGSDESVYAINMTRMGTMLRQARRAAGLSQRGLASEAGVPHSTIARIETGAIDPRATTLDRLLRVCGRELDTFRAIGAGVDRSQLRERLGRSPRGRIDDLVAAASAMERIRGRAPRPS